MVVTLAVPARQFFGLKHIITIDHLELMNKIMLATGLMVGYAYGMEFFIAWYSGSLYEGFAFVNRAFGPYAWAYWTMIACNVILPAAALVQEVPHATPGPCFAIGIVINVGMWFERFVIIVTSLARDFLPSSWGYYVPDVRRLHDARRQLRPVLHPVPAVLPLPADGGDGRSQGLSSERSRPRPRPRRGPPPGRARLRSPSPRARATEMKLGS